MDRTEKYKKIREELLQKEAMLTLYYSDRIRFHNLIITIMKNEE